MYIDCVSPENRLAHKVPSDEDHDNNMFLVFRMGGLVHFLLPFGCAYE